MTESNYFSRIHLYNWRQFGDVNLDLSARLTILTGANAAGKTSIVSLLGRHFNWASNFISLPIRTRDGRIRYILDRPKDDSAPTQLDGPSLPHDYTPIGELGYGDGGKTSLALPGGEAQIYDVYIAAQQMVPGLYLASHRTLSSYRPVESIPAQFNSSDQVLEQYINEIRQRYAGGYSNKPPMLVMKESLLAAAIYSQGSDAVEASRDAAEVWNGFQETLRLLMPTSLGFQRLIARPPEIIVETYSGEFVIDSVSGGLSAILEIAWQIYLRSRQHKQLTVCMDEPENHLHPSLQRAIMPSLLRAFPNTRFIVATHSPFVVTSERDANIYALDYADGQVYSKLLDFADKSASAENTLREVLGVESTIPVWAETRFNEIVGQYSSLTVIDANILRALRADLIGEGLGASLPRALDALLVDEGNEGA